MQVILKWVAQLILLPLIKEAVLYLVYKVKTYREDKKLEKANKDLVDAFNKAPAASAHDDFKRLP